MMYILVVSDVMIDKYLYEAQVGDGIKPAKHGGVFLNEHFYDCVEVVEAFKSHPADILKEWGLIEVDSVRFPDLRENIILLKGSNE